MSISLMNGFVAERDSAFTNIFLESYSAIDFLKKFLPNNGDSWWYEGVGQENSPTWCELKNVNSRLRVEVGEGAA